MHVYAQDLSLQILPSEIALARGDAERSGRSGSPAPAAIGVLIGALVVLLYLPVFELAGSQK